MAGFPSHQRLAAELGRLFREAGRLVVIRARAVSDTSSARAAHCAEIAAKSGREPSQ